jgi:hypothetical protein
MLSFQSRYVKILNLIKKQQRIKNKKKQLLQKKSLLKNTPNLKATTTTPTTPTTPTTTYPISYANYTYNQTKLWQGICSFTRNNVLLCGTSGDFTLGRGVLYSTPDGTSGNLNNTNQNTSNILAPNASSIFIEISNFGITEALGNSFYGVRYLIPYTSDNINATSTLYVCGSYVTSNAYNASIPSQITTIDPSYSAADTTKGFFFQCPYDGIDSSTIIKNFANSANITTLGWTDPSYSSDQIMNTITFAHSVDGPGATQVSLGVTNPFMLVVGITTTIFSSVVYQPSLLNSWIYNNGIANYTPIVIAGFINISIYGIVYNGYYGIGGDYPLCFTLAGGATSSEGDSVGLIFDIWTDVAGNIQMNNGTINIPNIAQYQYNNNTAISNTHFEGISISSSVTNCYTLAGDSFNASNTQGGFAIPVYRNYSLNTQQDGGFTFGSPIAIQSPVLNNTNTSKTVTTTNVTTKITTKTGQTITKTVPTQITTRTPLYYPITSANTIYNNYVAGVGKGGGALDPPESPFQALISNNWPPSPPSTS